MSVRDLGEKAGVSTKTIVQLDHGRQLPNFGTIQKLSQALDVQPMEVTEFAAAIEARAAAPATR
jgi:DNA-binding XRE family transcriptional regulator